MLKKCLTPLPLKGKVNPMNDCLFCLPIHLKQPDFKYSADRFHSLTSKCIYFNQNNTENFLDQTFSVSFLPLGKTRDIVIINHNVVNVCGHFLVNTITQLNLIRS